MEFRHFYTPTKVFTSYSVSAENITPAVKYRSSNMHKLREFCADSGRISSARETAQQSNFPTTEERQVFLMDIYSKNLIEAYRNVIRKTCRSSVVGKLLCWAVSLAE